MSNFKPAVFDRRKVQTQLPQYPLIDSDGVKVECNRRSNAAFHLQKIEVKEQQIQESDFKKLFSK